MKTILRLLVFLFISLGLLVLAVLLLPLLLLVGLLVLVAGGRRRQSFSMKVHRSGFRRAAGPSCEWSASGTDNEPSDNTDASDVVIDIEAREVAPPRRGLR